MVFGSHRKIAEARFFASLFAQARHILPQLCVSVERHEAHKTEEVHRPKHLSLPLSFMLLRTIFGEGILSTSSTRARLGPE